MVGYLHYNFPFVVDVNSIPRMREMEKVTVAKAIIPSGRLWVFGCSNGHGDDCFIHVDDFAHRFLES